MVGGDVLFVNVGTCGVPSELEGADIGFPAGVIERAVVSTRNRVGSAPQEDGR